MGVDWRELTWWQYQAILWNWNDRQSPEKPEPDYNRLRKAMAVH